MTTHPHKTTDQVAQLFSWVSEKPSKWKSRGPQWRNEKTKHSPYNGWAKTLVQNKIRELGQPKVSKETPRLALEIRD